MEAIISITIAVIGMFIGVTGWLRQGKKDYASLESRLIVLEEQSKKVSERDITILGQKVESLEGKVHKLDTDVEKKIDQLSNKIDEIFTKLNEVLVVLAKNDK